MTKFAVWRCTASSPPGPSSIYFMENAEKVKNILGMVRFSDGVKKSIEKKMLVSSYAHAKWILCRKEVDGVNAVVKKVASDGSRHEVTTFVMRNNVRMLESVSIVDVERGTCSGVRYTSERISCVCILLVENEVGLKPEGYQSIHKYTADIDSPSRARDNLGKLEVTWRGPFEVVDMVSTHVFVICHLVDSKRRKVHTTRLKFY